MSGEQSSFVFDASAILALLRRESGHEEIEDFLEGSRVSAVNLCEAATKLEEEGNPADEVAVVLDALNLTVVPFNTPLALRAASLRNPTKHVSLSLGDRACLATAIDLGLPVVTTDRIWTKLDLGIPIHVVR
ncbi:MAG: type II toxin-antitoxin system VapC family toxin [Bryobacterales bacterium]